MVSPLLREHANNRWRCLAETEHILQVAGYLKINSIYLSTVLISILQPPYTDIVTEMNLPVLDIRLVSLPSPLQVGQCSALLQSCQRKRNYLLYIFTFTTILQADSSYEVLCQVIGAAPAPEISWTLTSAHGISRTLAAGPPQLSARGNLSTSVLELAVTSAEHGSELSCSARVGEAGLFPEVNITRLLAVSHPPRVRVTIVGEVTRLVGASIDLYNHVSTHI